MAYAAEYLLFLAKVVTIVVAVIAVSAGLVAAIRRGRPEKGGRLTMRHLNAHYETLAHAVESATLPRRDLRRLRRQRKRERHAGRRRRLFVLDFSGDLRASAVSSLREEVTAILSARRPDDEVLVRLESVGGLVAAYGLAAAQLARLREAGVRLTVSADRVAASGGYMMACVANQILAAPFAVVGSIGVIAQMPNFHRLLKKHDIDYEQFQAGEYKRTVTVFGENTDENRAKFRDQLEDIHQMFKAFVARYRPELEIDRVATGEYWYGNRAIELKLVDFLQTSDDYLLSASAEADLYELRYNGWNRPRLWPLWNSERRG